PQPERPPQAANSKSEGRVTGDMGLPRPLQALRPSLAAPAATLAERRSESDGPRDAASTAAPGAPEIGIQLRRWTPDAPYIARFAKAEPADLYRIYLDERPGYMSSTAFFLDAAD